MPLQLVWIGLKRYLDTGRKIFFVGVTFLAIFYLFFALVNVDNKRNSTGPTAAQIEEARRLKLYDTYDVKNDPKDDEEGVLVRELTRGFLCSTTGELCTGNPAEAYKYKEQSLAYKASGIIAEPLRHPPSSFYYWARGTLENAGFVPKTYAQGIGFAALTSFQPIWKVFRNLAYLVIVVVIMVVGFMVMFKVGGGGKNAVTLESALPKLVIALLAISMSYALAGFLIDVMYMVIALVINMLGPISGMDPATQTKMMGSVMTGSPTDLFFMLMGNIGQSDGNYYNLAGSLYSLVPGYMQTVINAVVNNLVIGGLGEWKTQKTPDISTTPGSNVKNVATFMGRAFTLVSRKIWGLRSLTDRLGDSGSGPVPVSTIANIIYIIFGYIVGALIGTVMVKVAIMFILILGMIVIFFRLFFMLIMNYVDIILSILIAPLSLMLEAIPGQNAFVNWIRGLAVNLGVYPIVLVVILIARAIMDTGGTISPMWSPPFVSTITDQTSLQTLISAVLVFSLPSIIKTYKQKLKPASITDSMGIGLGSLFVGASPILRGSSTVMGASGITTAMAKRVTAPLQTLFKDQMQQTVKIANP
ncbi:hypothetical protein KBB12_00065 [Candidatus Woesebacteria bacterium]|nr:hypothetical protein [Candidatus Woesebacteria bacterium]